MRTMVVLLLLVAACALSGCASRYWTDRGRDAMDIFTAQIGYGGGAKARVGPLQAGLLMDIGLAGLRGGSLLGDEEFIPAYAEIPVKQDYDVLLFGIEAFEGDTIANLRGKSFQSDHIFLAWPVNLENRPESAVYAMEHRVIYNPWPFFTQMEAVAGLFLNIRLGANPGELLDFLLGWTTLDIYGDDLGVLKLEPVGSAPMPEVREPF